MAKKIKVNIAGAAFTGKIVTFKAPCDCTEATGLVIGEDTYDVVDALGNCITGSYLAWRSGALVSVALDVEDKTATLQSSIVGGGGGGNAQIEEHNKDTAAHADIRNAIPTTAAEIGAAPAVESGEHPGCYYREVDGVAEYVNPPMELGVEYRTTERYEGKPVYTKLFEIFPLPATAGAMTTPEAGLVSAESNRIIDVNGFLTYHSVYLPDVANDVVGLRATARTVLLTAKRDLSNSGCKAIIKVKYIK